MLAGGPTETIWHFAGYMHIADVLARSEVLFNGARSARLSEDDPTKDTSQQPRFQDLEDIGSRAVLPPGLEVFDTARLPAEQRLNALAPDYAKSLSQAREDLRPVNFQPNPNAFGAPANTPAPVIISVNYGEADGEGQIAIHQVNLAEDHDVLTKEQVVLRDHHGEVVALPTLDMRQELDLALASAKDVAVGDFQPFLEDQGITTELFETRNAAWKADTTSNDEGHITHGAVALDEGSGRYVDGVLSDAEIAETNSDVLAPWRVETADQLAENTSVNGEPLTRELDGPSGAPAVINESGLNTQLNAARIVDANEMTGSLIVGGDHFFSQAIVQVNVLTDNDHITINTVQGPLPSIFEAGNEVHNVAEFVHNELTATPKGAAFTPNWNVDVMNGDFIDLKSLTQFNGLSDNDTASQCVTGTFFNLNMGLNEQTNLVNIFGLDRYDIIIIKGDYHQADWIFQYNIMVDCDTIFAAEQGALGNNTMTAGGNSLTNNASITTYDGGDFKPITASQLSLMDQLDAGDTVLVGNPEWQLAGNASGTLNVLYITGDYYDINVISQINVMVDADLSVQVLPDSTAAQGAITGGNNAMNDAIIIDAGTFSQSQFLGGTSYEESVLIQVNIVTSDDHIAINDPHALVPEVIAFIDECDSTQPPDCLEPTVYQQAQQDHIMSSGMV
jgi:hypothetical protein